MERKSTFELGRRHFITRFVPACALTCFGAPNLRALVQSDSDPGIKRDIHKFDRELERTPTLRQYYGALYRGVIELSRALEKGWGKEKTLEFLKEHTTERMTEYGKKQAAQSPDNTFRTYTDTFRNLDTYKNTLTMEVVEDSERIFELKVSECIWASVFRQADAGDIGFAHVCFGDYAWTRAFNPEFTMVRDRTLMEGHDICNHRYIWKG